MSAAADVARRARLFFLLARPPLVVVLGLFGALGVAHAGHASDLVALLRVLLVVAGFVACAVAVNDLGDAAVDRINVPGDPRRPFSSGAVDAVEMRTVAVVGGGLALAVAASIGPVAVAVTAAGLVLVVAYSVPPLKLSTRGVLAPLVLPFGFVAVPFLTGVASTGSGVDRSDLALLAGLYLGFVGRILLKDFRDVRGDTLLGKRTFLVRRGRVWTCRLSALMWTAGSVTLLAVTDVRLPVALAYAVLLAVALVLLRALARSTGPRTDEALVAALAIVGRGLVVALLVHYGTVQAGTTTWLAALVMLTVTTAVLVWAYDAARHGLVTRLVVSAGLVQGDAAAGRLSGGPVSPPTPRGRPASVSPRRP